MVIHQPISKRGGYPNNDFNFRFLISKLISKSFFQRGSYPNNANQFRFRFQFPISIFVFSSCDNRIIPHLNQFVNNFFFILHFDFFYFGFLYNVHFYFAFFTSVFFVSHYNALFSILSDFLYSTITYTTKL